MEAHTLASMFESNKQALGQALEGLTLPKNASKILNIVSKYFESFQDYFHLEMSTKKCKGNCERFRYNPISLSSSTIQFFPNIVSVQFVFLPSDVSVLQDKI